MLGSLGGFISWRDDDMFKFLIYSLLVGVLMCAGCKTVNCCSSDEISVRPVVEDNYIPWWSN